MTRLDKIKPPASAGGFDRELSRTAARAALAAVVAGYLLAGGTLAWLSRNQINPDGVAYIQLARHYAHGRFDLAVSSYWGPLLPWLLAPSVWLGLDPQLSFKLLNLALGLGLGLGACRLALRQTANIEHRTRNVEPQKRPKDAAFFPSPFCILCSVFDIRFVAAPTVGQTAPRAKLPVPLLAGALALALYMLPDPLTPDVLLAMLMTFYFAVSAGLLERSSHRRALAAGLIGGLAYLAKTYALVFVPLHLALTVALGLLARRLSLGRALVQLALALAGLAIVALPWIAVISVKDGRPTIGSVSRYADTIVYSVRTGRDPPMHRLQVPRAGRLHVWENPPEIPQGFFDEARPAADSGGRAAVVADNLGRFWQIVKEHDPLAPLAAVWLATAATILMRLLAAAGRHPQAQGRLGVAPELFWLWASAGMYAGGYMLVLLEARYLWPIYGLLLVLGLRLLGGRGYRSRASGFRLQASGTTTAPNPEARGPRPEAAAVAAPAGAGLGQAMRALLAVVFVAAIVVEAWINVQPWLIRGGKAAQWDGFAAGMSGLQRGPLTASPDWYLGLFASFRSDSPFLGELKGRSPAAIADELRPFGAVRILVFDNPILAAELEQDAAFRPSPNEQDGPGGPRVFYYGDR